MSWTTGKPLSIPDGPLIEPEQTVGPPSADVEQAWAFARGIADSVSELQEGLFDDLRHPRNREGEWIDTGHHEVEEVSDSERVGRALAESLGSFTHGGITATLAPRSSFKGGHSDIWLNFALSGQYVGFARVTLPQRNSRGQRVAMLENLFLKTDYQDRGFGTAITQHLFAQLRAHGIDRMRLNAVEVGSYVWARSGFTWVKDAKSEQQRIVRGAQQSADWAQIEKHVSADTIAELLDKAKHGEFTSEAELAAFGRDQVWVDDKGHTVWLGKQIMLDSTWDGERAP